MKRNALRNMFASPLAGMAQVFTTIDDESRRMATGVLLRAGVEVRGELATNDEIRGYMIDNHPDLVPVFDGSAPNGALSRMGERVAGAAFTDPSEFANVGYRHQYRTRQFEADQVARSQGLPEAPAVSVDPNREAMAALAEAFLVDDE
jgi:hypothetical protein